VAASSTYRQLKNPLPSQEVKTTRDQKIVLYLARPRKRLAMLSTDPSSEATPPDGTDHVVIIIPTGRASRRLVHPFSLAVSAAIAAHARTGRIVDAALAYAAHGIPVFPVSINSKRPIPKKDVDADGKPIDGTGGFKKATTDPKQIREWWWKNQRHLIGVPMGDINKIWTLDIDTTIDHDDDGVAALQGLIAEYGEIHTREHLTATDGLHLIFTWSADNPIGCSKGLLPKGLDVKAHGSYIVGPPSYRKGKAYTVKTDIDPSDAPEWLYDLIGRRRPINSNDDAVSITDPVSSIWDQVGMPPSSRTSEPYTSTHFCWNMSRHSRAEPFVWTTT
jgi:hypothetical protein